MIHERQTRRAEPLTAATRREGPSPLPPQVTPQPDDVPQRQGFIILLFYCCFVTLLLKFYYCYFVTKGFIILLFLII